VRWADPSSRGVIPNVYVSVGVIRRNNNPLHLQWVGRRGQTKKDRTTLLFAEVTDLGHRKKCENKQWWIGKDFDVDDHPFVTK
jgi:hypothetical protein